MSRILAFDYGNKRIGVAVTDENQIIAQPLSTIPNFQFFSFLENYLKTENVEKFIIGLPKQTNNLPSESFLSVKNFVSQLQKKFPTIPVVFIDERFTSKMAARTLVEAGIKKMKRQDKNLLDKISASLILQTYLEQKNHLSELKE